MIPAVVSVSEESDRHWTLLLSSVFITVNLSASDSEDLSLGGVCDSCSSL